jgi:ZIP family zinc transporter
MNSGQILIPFLLTLIAGLSTVLGSFIFFNHFFCKRKFIGFFLGLSAGVMIYLSFTELLPFSIKSIGFLMANVLFFTGIIVMALIDFITPHCYLEEKFCKKHSIVDRKLLSTGLIVTLGLIVHNIPEGIAVFLSSFTNIKFGFLLALAIAVHNVPEGIAVAAPIFHATHNRIKAIKYAFISGMAEPIGAIIAYLILRPYLNQDFLSYIFALIAGIMVYISFDELLPASFRDDQGHRAIIGIITGMIIVSFSLIFL